MSKFFSAPIRTECDVCQKYQCCVNIEYTGEKGANREPKTGWVYLCENCLNAALKELKSKILEVKKLGY